MASKYLTHLRLDIFISIQCFLRDKKLKISIFSYLFWFRFKFAVARMQIHNLKKKWKQQLNSKIRTWRISLFPINAIAVFQRSEQNEEEKKHT